MTAAAAVTDLAIDASSISCLWIGESCYATPGYKEMRHGC